MDVGVQRYSNRSISAILPCTNLKSKLIKDLNINSVTLKLREEKLEIDMKCTGTRDNCLNRTPVAQSLRLTISKWEIMKLKSSCKARDTVNWTEWEKSFIHPTFDSVLISKIYKELKKVDIKNK